MNLTVRQVTTFTKTVWRLSSKNNAAANKVWSRVHGAVPQLSDPVANGCGALRAAGKDGELNEQHLHSHV